MQGVDYMEKISNLNLKAQENLIIAAKEKLVALELKKLAKYLLKKAKSREKFAEREISLAQIRTNLVENNKILSEHRIRSKELLKFSDDEIKNEKNFTTYHENIVENQLESARHHKELAKLEENLAKSKILAANSKIQVANIRIKLSRLQLKYAKVIQKNSSEKIMMIKSVYKQKQNELHHLLQELMEKENNVNIIQKDIAKLQSKLSQT